MRGLRRPLTRTLQGRLTLMAVLATAATLAALTVTFNLLLERSVDRDASSRLRNRAAAALTTLSTGNGRIHVGEAPDDAAVDNQLWVYEGRRALERPAVAPALQSAADALAGGPRRYEDVAGGSARLYAVPVVQGGRRLGTVVAGTSLTPYDRTTDSALVGSIVFAALVLLIVTLLTRAVTRAALRPVAEMTSTAAEWSEHSLGQRFGDARRPDELGQLAATFDGLLDRLGASLRHEQRFSAELSHELRTPLARVTAETDMLLRRRRSLDEYQRAAEVIHASAAEMARILDTLLAAARVEGGIGLGRGDVRVAAARVVDACRPEAAERGVSVNVLTSVAAVRAGVDEEVIERVLAPLVQNATRHASSAVTVAVERHDGRVTAIVTDELRLAHGGRVAVRRSRHAGGRRQRRCLPVDDRELPVELRSLYREPERARARSASARSSSTTSSRSSAPARRRPWRCAGSTCGSSRGSSSRSSGRPAPARARRSISPPGSTSRRPATSSCSGARSRDSTRPSSPPIGRARSRSSSRAGTCGRRCPPGRTSRSRCGSPAASDAERAERALDAFDLRRARSAAGGLAVRRRAAAGRDRRGSGAARRRSCSPTSRPAELDERNEQIVLAGAARGCATSSGAPSSSSPTPPRVADVSTA